ncbi:MAG: glycosyltransferase [Acetobacteraceae bacterium]|nr:glycosyltransferase [Acetobacteraceae bacterium]
MSDHDWPVTVILPSYNRADLLPATLATILGQTHRPAAVIVVDDGSTDATPALLAGYAPAVQTIRVANGGDLVARNVGLRATRTPFAAFCDSDDLWTPDHLAGMAALWRAAPALVAAYADFRVVRDGGWQERSKFDDAPPGFWDGLRAVGPELGVFELPVVDRLLAFQPFFPSAMAVRLDRFAALGGWDDVARPGCDFATALRVAEHPPLGVVRRATVGIRKHDGNFSRDVQAMHLRDSQGLEHVLATRPGLAPHAAAIRASIERRRREAFDTAFARRDFAGARAIYALLPPRARPAKLRLKRALATLPAGFVAPVVSLRSR